MSTIENSFDKASNFVRNIFNINDEPSKDAKKPAPAQELKKTTSKTNTEFVPNPDSKTQQGGADAQTRTTESNAQGGLLNRIQTRMQIQNLLSQQNYRQTLPQQSIQQLFSQQNTQQPFSQQNNRHISQMQQPSNHARTYVRAADLSQGGSAGTTDAQTIAQNVQNGLKYFETVLGRNGLDGAGSGVDVLVNDRRLDETGREMFKGNGGYYALPDQNGIIREAIHFGKGETKRNSQGIVDQVSMGYANDLVVHELTHGIIRKETGKLGGGADEPGATNEAIADVMAAAATRDWTIGEGMYSAKSNVKKMRNIANPDDPQALHGLWTSMNQFLAEQKAGRKTEEHWASGIISTAAQRIQQRLGGETGWKAVEQVFYNMIDKNQMGDMSFNAIARGLRSSASALYGQNSSVAWVFNEELRRAGL